MIQPVGTQIPIEIRGLDLTNTQRQILEILSDGKGHTIESLKRYDTLLEDMTIQTHTHRLRKKLVATSYRVYSGHEQGNKLLYRLVKLL